MPSQDMVVLLMQRCAPYAMIGIAVAAIAFIGTIVNKAFIEGMWEPERSEILQPLETHIGLLIRMWTRRFDKLQQGAKWTRRLTKLIVCMIFFLSVGAGSVTCYEGKVLLGFADRFLGASILCSALPILLMTLAGRYWYAWKAWYDLKTLSRRVSYRSQ